MSAVNTRASAEEVANEGEQVLPTLSNEGVATEQKWQIAEIARPLCSVGEECDKEQLVVFGKTGGMCINLLDNTCRYFPRTPSGAYEMDMWFPTPELLAQLGKGEHCGGNNAGFAWQGR